MLARRLASVTYFETTGWQGVLETETGSPEPALFPSRPGEVFPLYHVLADLAELRDAELVAVTSGDPFSVEALALQDAAGLHLLLANLTPEPREVALELPAEGAPLIRRLNDISAASAMATPQDFRRSGTPLDQPTVTLAPFEVVRIDARS